MHHHEEPARNDYPHGRGYGHDYMRGGEIDGGYGYAEREEYRRTRGEQQGLTGGEPGSEDNGRA